MLGTPGAPRCGRYDVDRGDRADVTQRGTPPRRPTPSGEGVHRDEDAVSAVGADSQQPAAGDWRVAALAGIRTLITEAVPEVVEEVKWRRPSNPAGVLAWSHDGLLCTGETYKDHVKVTFAKGARLEDPGGLFNASLDGALRRAVDLREGDSLDPVAFVELVRAAVSLNESARRRR